jgi:predicted Fe-S protein YdhL (DUF1289 family)
MSQPDKSFCYLPVSDAASRWAREVNGPTADQAENALWRAYWRGDLKFYFRSPDTGVPHYKGSERRGRREERTRVPSDEYREITRELLAGFLSFRSHKIDRPDEEMAETNDNILQETLKNLGQMTVRDMRGASNDLDKAYICGAGLDRDEFAKWLRANKLAKSDIITNIQQHSLQSNKRGKKLAAAMNALEQTNASLMSPVKALQNQVNDYLKTQNPPMIISPDTARRARDELEIRNKASRSSGGNSRKSRKTPA